MRWSAGNTVESPNSKTDAVPDAWAEKSPADAVWLMIELRALTSSCGFCAEKASYWPPDPAFAMASTVVESMPMATTNTVMPCRVEGSPPRWPVRCRRSCRYRP